MTVIHGGWNLYIPIWKEGCSYSLILLAQITTTLVTSNNRNVFSYSSRGFRSKSGVPRAVLSRGSVMSLLMPLCQHALAADKAWHEGHYSSLPSICHHPPLWVSLLYGSAPSFPPFFLEGYVREFSNIQRVPDSLPWKLQGRLSDWLQKFSMIIWGIGLHMGYNLNSGKLWKCQIIDWVCV